MEYGRVDRVAQEIKKELSDLISNHLRDPDVQGMCSIVHCEVTKDFRHAKVYVSVYAPKQEQDKAIKALERASGFLRKELGGRIRTHYTPELRFILDDSIEHGIHISKMLKELIKDDDTDPKQ